VLDTPHFGGGNTSYEALAMGTPIVTMPGEFLRSRITAALYRKMGFSALIADSPRRYVELALAAAADPTFRDHCRREIAIRSNVLFEDPAEIHSLEEWLASLAEA
jgi:protein O-GlcNAc transferase